MMKQTLLILVLLSSILVLLSSGCLVAVDETEESFAEENTQEPVTSSGSNHRVPARGPDDGPRGCGYQPIEVHTLEGEASYILIRIPCDDRPDALWGTGPEEN